MTTQLQDLLTAAGVEHFVARELYSSDDVPPSSVVGHVVPAALLADDIRKRWGRAVKVLSGGGYRSPELNARVGGAKRSQHLRFRALDLRPLAGDADFRRFLDIARGVVDEWRARGYIVGLGIYDGSRKPRARGRKFVHVDVVAEDARESGDRRRSATWKG